MPRLNISTGEGPCDGVKVDDDTGDADGLDFTADSDPNLGV